MADMTEWGSDLALPVFRDRDHIRGPVDAPITLLEYGDYQCPFCRQAVTAVDLVAAELGERVRIVYRHFPLSTIHPFAQITAEAAEAAGSQGMFWQMHDLLFADQEHLAPPDLVARAVALGLDRETFELALIDHTFGPKVHEDFLSGVHSGVSGTPTFFINGLRYRGPADPGHLLTAAELPLTSRM
jgi:protein-disulfide isomerase